MIASTNYIPGADLCTIALCLLCLAFLRSSYTAKSKNLFLFKLAVVLIAVSSVCSLLYHKYIVTASASAELITLLHNLTYNCLMFTFLVFIFYLCNLVQMPRKPALFYHLAAILIFIAHAVFQELARITHFGFWIEKTTEGYIGNEHLHAEIYHIAYILFAVLAMILLLSYRKHFITNMFITIVSVVFISYFLVFVQDVLYSASFLCFSFMLPVLTVLFLFHYNPYDLETGTLDLKAFSGYIKEMKGHPFGLVYLHLETPTPNQNEKLKTLFFHFNEEFFKFPVTFRAAENRLLMIYSRSKNRDYKQRLETMLNHFKELYDEYQIPYRIVLVESSTSIISSQDYLEFCEYVEHRQPVNSIYRVDARDYQAFARIHNILAELKDIEKNMDLNDSRVLVYCQPVYDISTRSFSTAEALMRLKLPTMGLIYPDEFIPLAEKHNLIHSLSKIILNKTCYAIKEFERQKRNIERISVNVSMIELRNENFCNDIVTIIENCGIPFSKIAIELTESKNEDDFELVKSVMTELHSKGIKFYLDDFGTGYSNFAQIIGLPIDIIKFDRSLTRLSDSDLNSMFLVSSFSELFHKTKYGVLFEGIEDAQDERRCVAMNARYLQGYKYSKPIPISDLYSFLSEKE